MLQKMTLQEQQASIGLERTLFSKETQIMKCDICGQEGARVRRVTRSYGRNEDLLVIENVPVVSCPHCGQSYLVPETLYEIERIKLHRNNFAVKRPVYVAEFV